MIRRLLIVGAAAIAVSACAPAGPPPGPPVGARPLPGGQWVLLGSRRVNWRVDRDTIRVGRRYGRFRAIRLVVRRNAVNFIRVAVRFGNGQVQEIPIRRVIPAGGRTRVIDLAGRRRFISAVRMVYRTRPQFRGRAVVQVFGLR